MKHKNKNLIYPLIAIVFILFVINSCKKDNYGTADNYNACLLTKIAWTDLETGNEQTIEFEYNSHRKPVKIIYNFGWPYSETIKYGENEKISATMKLRDSTVFTWTDSSLTKDTYQEEQFGWPDDAIYKTVYDLDTEGYIVKCQSNNLFEAGYYELYAWEYGNIYKKEKWAPSFNIGFGDSSMIYKLFRQARINTPLKYETDTIYTCYTYEYDNKKNAFSSLGILWGSRGTNKNNITKMVSISSNGNTSTDNIKYEYNEKGFPIKSQGGSFNEVTHFEYDCN